MNDVKPDYKLAKCCITCKHSDWVPMIGEFMCKPIMSADSVRGAAIRGDHVCSEYEVDEDHE